MSTWTTIRNSTVSLLGTVAPGLATALAGPLAGQAVAAISSTLLGHPNGTHDAVDAAIVAATPEQLLALKTADQNFTLAMKNAGIDLRRIAAADKDSARKYAATNQRMVNVLTILLLLGAGATAYGVLTDTFPGLRNPTTAVTAGTMIGYIWRELRECLSLFFGGSTEDDATAPKS